MRPKSTIGHSPRYRLLTIAARANKVQIDLKLDTLIALGAQGFIIFIAYRIIGIARWQQETTRVYRFQRTNVSGYELIEVNRVTCPILALRGTLNKLGAVTV